MSSIIESPSSPKRMNQKTFQTPLQDNMSFVIRDCYETFYSKIITTRTLLPPNSRGLGMWITGTPRIGKSVFLFYVAKRLKEDNIDFIITIGETWYNDKYEKKEYSQLEECLSNRLLIHLIDPEDKPVPHLQRHYAFAIFFASPTLKNIEPYHQKELYVLFMPLWTKVEMEGCCKTLEIPFSDDIFDKWGGVFIDSFRARLLEDQLKRVLGSSTIRDLLSNLQNDSLQEPINQHQWLLHRHPNADYTSCEIQLPSHFVEKQVIAVLNKVKFKDVMDCNSSILGRLYEQHVSSYFLIAGAELLAIPYDKRATSMKQKEIKIEEVHEYTNVCVISEIPKNNTMYLPKEKNKQGIDGVLITATGIAWAIQITIGNKHKPLEVGSILRQFPFHTDLYMLVIHPKPLESSFKYPNVFLADNKQEVTATKRYICQYSGYL